MTTAPPVDGTGFRPASFDDSYDPADLILEDNIRLNAAATLDRDNLRELVAAHGVRLPILAVWTESGQAKVKDGARRTLAAIEAGQRVPVLFLGNEDTTRDGQAQRIADQFMYGTSGEPLDSASQAGAVQAMLDLGLKPGQIGKALHLKPNLIQAARKTAGSPLAMEAAAAYGLDLLDAGVIGEFDGDEAAQAELVRTLEHSPGQFRHKAAEFRRLRDQAAKTAGEAAALREAGYHVVTDDDDAPAPHWWQYVKNLRGSDGQELTAEAHQECQYRGVLLHWEHAGWQGNSAKYRLERLDYCTDPGAAGHKDRTGEVPGEEPAAAAAEDQAEKAAKAQAAATEERRRVRAGNKAWRAARDVRAEWVRTVLLARKLPADALWFATAELARGEAFKEGHQVACAFLGISLEAADPDATPATAGFQASASASDKLMQALDEAKTPPKQTRILLGMALGCLEHQVTDDTWRHDAGYGWAGVPQGTRLIAALIAWGYQASEIELACGVRRWERPADPAPEPAPEAGDSDD